MKTLILTVSAGHGHNVAAEAIAEYVLSQEPDSTIKIVDTLKYISPVLDKVLIGTYLNSLKIYPKAFTYFFSAFNKKEDSILPILDKLDEMVALRILPLIAEVEPDVIISTHPFTTQMLSVLSEGGKLFTPTLAIITDYGSHALWIHPGIDYYIVAHESVVPELVAAGRDWETVLPYGIPIKSSFIKPADRSETLRSIGLKDDLLTVTLMGGSLALGHIKTILKELDSIPRQFNIVVVAANNQKLYDEAVDISLKSDKSIAVLKFCHFMDALMQSTDLLVTKPGGLTVTEALITGTPMAIFKAIGGQEEQNRQFLLKNGLAIDIGEGEDSAGKIESLLFHEDQLEKLRQLTRSFAKPDSTKQVYHQLRKMVDEANEAQHGRSALPAANLDEGFNERFKSLVEELKLRLESNRLTSAIMERVRGNARDDDEEDFYELTDEEITTLLDESAASDGQGNARAKR